MKKTRDIKLVREIVNRLVKPDNLIQQRKQIEEHMQQTTEIINNLKDLFEKYKGKPEATPSG